MTAVLDRALDVAVRQHFESRHAAGLCVPFGQIGERSRRIVREQLRGTVEAVLAAAQAAPTGDPTSARMLAEYRVNQGRSPRLGCSLVAHRDLGFCAGCLGLGMNVELNAWRLLAMAERGIPDQPSEAPGGDT